MSRRADQHETLFRFGPYRRFHFIGVGGIGMSGIAEVLLRAGFEVSGSDLSDGPILDSLRHLGGRLAVGHAADNLREAQAVVLSSAIPLDNPERAEAERRGLPLVHRAEMLAELMRQRQGVTVTGTHGKTTVTSMLASILIECGSDPTVLNGARLEIMKSNARLGGGPLLLAEADESDRSFLRFFPVHTLITNIDRDHMEAYSGFEDLKQAFSQHLERIPFYGTAVICRDDPVLRQVGENVHTPLVTYGLQSTVKETSSRCMPDCAAQKVRLQGFGSRFEVLWRGRLLGEVELKVPGRHNVLNALGSLAMALELGCAFEPASRALSRFAGAERRTQIKGERQGVLVMDDYGHHPTEIRATLKALSKLGRRLVVVYQPHRYTRTRDLMEETAAAFEHDGLLFLMDIYAAGQEPIEGVNSKVLAEHIARHREVEHVASTKDLQARLKAECRSGDVLLTLGAGDVWKAGEEYLG
ncbi:MAG TPA: UDP-N-acetylmuramate--L-alanine ligase [Acidobacteriota bacterium]|nr:UDP-N-acetylmuramate--L-alanine ligase [Acidobacteriota bacterium]